MKTKSRSAYPQVYNPDGTWAGFMIDEDSAKAWCKKVKGRRYDWTPLPVIERVKTEVKKSVKRVVKGRESASAGTVAPKRRSSRSVAPSKPQNIEWDASDIEDEKKLSEVAEKSKNEAIKKLKEKK